LLEAAPLPKRISVLLLPAREQIPLSVTQIRLLLQVALPLPMLAIPAALALIAYQPRQKRADYRSHRKRIMKRLMTLRW
jgi:hypothetical protein